MLPVLLMVCRWGVLSPCLSKASAWPVAKSHCSRRRRALGLPATVCGAGEQFNFLSLCPLASDRSGLNWPRCEHPASAKVTGFFGWRACIWEVHWEAASWCALGMAVLTELYWDVSAAALNVAIHVLYQVVGGDWPEQEMERKIISPPSGGCIGVCVGMNGKLFLVFFWMKTLEPRLTLRWELCLCCSAQLQLAKAIPTYLQ